jgi:FMN phosphatase YigB (HAD superfamily)
MYRHASDRLGLKPYECVFVDDDESLVVAAVELGYVGRTVWRENAPAPRRTATIAAIDELLELF